MTRPDLKAIRALVDANAADRNADMACLTCDPLWRAPGTVPRGLCSSCKDQLDDAIPDLLDYCERLERELSEYRQAVADKLHYDMHAMLADTPKNAAERLLGDVRAERDRLAAQLAAMTAARDEACDGWERCREPNPYDKGDRARIDALRKVGSAAKAWGLVRASCDCKKCVAPRTALRDAIAAARAERGGKP